MLADVIKNMVTDQQLNTRDFYEKLLNADKKISAEFGIGVKEKKEEHDQSGFMKLMIILFGLGLLFLLVSFIPFGEMQQHRVYPYWGVH